MLTLQDSILKYNTHGGTTFSLLYTSASELVRMIVLSLSYFWHVIEEGINYLFSVTVVVVGLNVLN